MYILHLTQVLGLNLETFHINSPAAAATCQTGRVDDEEEEATSQEMKLIIERLILLIFLSSASNDINKKETRLPSESNHLKRSGDLLGGVCRSLVSVNGCGGGSCLLYLILRGLLLAIELSSIWPIDVCRLLLFCDVSQGQRNTKPRRCV